MGLPAARVGDIHVCPMFDGPKPHVGGPVLPPGCPTVLIGGQPAARVGDMAVCVGPPDTIIQGEPTVLIGNKPAARMSDKTAHGGAIVMGFPTVLIGVTAQAACMLAAARSGAAAVRKASDAPQSASGDGGDATAAPSSPNADPAKEAEKKIMDKFGDDIPEAQKKVSGADATVFQDDKAFRKGIVERHPDIEKSYDLGTINGESYKGKIFINKDQANPGTVFHEQVHHYSSPAFKSEFHSVNGVKVNEGVTEHFTRQVYGGSRKGIYDMETKVADSLAKKVGDETLRKAYFGGDKESMDAVRNALTKK